MHFDPRQHAVDRRGAQVLQRRRRGADEDDLVLESARWNAIFQHVGERHILEARLAAAVGNERRCVVIDGNLEGADLERFEPPLLEPGLHRRSRTEGLCQQRAKDGERQRFVVLAVELDEQRHAPQHAVAVQERVDVARGRRVLDVDREVPGIALPLVEFGIAAGKAAFGQHRLRQAIDAHRAVLAVEVIAEHDRPAFHGRREARIEVERGPQRGVRRLELARILELALREPVEDIDAGARIALGPDHVERHELHVMALEELVDELGHQVAAPRPVADLAQALLVDVEDDDAVFARARHGHRKARVVHDVVQLGDEADALGAQRIAYEEQRDRKAEGDPYDVLSQIGPFRPSGRIPS